MSSTSRASDIHADPLGTNVGELIENQTHFTDQSAHQLTNTAPENTSSMDGCNVGRTEQKIRLIGGSALLAAAAFAPLGRNWRIGLAAVGAMEIVTGATRRCPLWSALGVNTCRDDER